MLQSKLQALWLKGNQISLDGLVRFANSDAWQAQSLFLRPLFVPTLFYTNDSSETSQHDTVHCISILLMLTSHFERNIKWIDNWRNMSFASACADDWELNEFWIAAINWEEGVIVINHGRKTHFRWFFDLGCNGFVIRTGVSLCQCYLWARKTGFFDFVKQKLLFIDFFGDSRTFGLRKANLIVLAPTARVFPVSLSVSFLTSIRLQ